MLSVDLPFTYMIYCWQVGDTPVVVFRIGNKESSISTIVLRGATDNFLDDVERAVNDGVNTFKAVTRVSECHWIVPLKFLMEVF